MPNGSVETPATEQSFLQRLEARKVYLPVEDRDNLLSKHGGETVDFVEALVTKELLGKETACRAWSDTIGVAYVDPLLSVVTQEAVDKVPLEIARKSQVMPLYFIHGTLTVAMADPLDEGLKRRLEFIAQCPVSPVFSLPSEIQAATEVNYATGEGVMDFIAAFEKEEGNLIERLAREDLDSLKESEILVKVVDAMLYFAIKERSSDIHIEAARDEARVRFRIDGRLREMFGFSRFVLPAIVCRLKVMSNLNIAESRFPQDGRFSIEMGVGQVDFRASFLPSLYGTKVVLRILSSGNPKQMITLDEMLISQSVLKPLRRLIQSPNGIFFVTGPTGSGKTTTLYAALNEINSPDLNISTIEDPIEIRLPGITQSQVNTHIDLRFNLLLRALLRQDPDIMLVGEIRDRETATIATEAALTGHLVLSTLHTNSAVQAIIRLIEIGIEPYMVAPSIIGVLAQRLAARLCEKCKQAYDPGPEVVDRLFYDTEGEEVTFYRGNGCPACRTTGYSGRIAFHELVLVSEKMRTLIAGNASGRELLEEARRLGYRSLRYDGLKKVLLGLTTIDEIEKKTSLEWSE